jgi:hypothetical protein
MIEESMGQRVYIETTIPSFYYEVRTEPEMIAGRNWTRTWWDNRRHAYLLVTSEAIIEIVDGRWSCPMIPREMPYTWPWRPTINMIFC